MVLTSPVVSLKRNLLKERLMELNPSGVTSTRIRLIWVNFSEILIKGNQI